ncbi:hypothetical protein AAVH_32485, partial [Aphelenchoides avenae]
MSDSDNVVVAVRVRPFNDREKQRNAQLIVDMPDGKRTAIRDPNNANDEPKWFTYDHSYWSHDGFKSQNGFFVSTEDKYADQRRVFDDLGRGVLDNAWKGYNCSLFAYGQTGSGKSYSIVGFGKNKGIVPLVCEELFRAIEERKGKSDAEYQVAISMLEIYCEKVRENPKTGFYVEGLTSTPVSSYKEIERKINEGTKNRTIAATNMNATSSRAHTIVKIQFVQKTPKPGGGTTTKSSEINLVDLAGSERQKDAGSEGDRLKEGIVINKSLSTLGRVIKALVEKQSSKSRNVQVAESRVITGCQIAAISPADINYEETLSTLRFADRAKSIKTKAVVNESATERMIRELKEENARLQDALRRGDIDGTVASQEELEALRRQLEENQKEMANLEKTWQQRLAEEQRKRGGHMDEETDVKRKEQPHLWNLNEDPALTDIIAHFIEKGDNTVGNGSSVVPVQIALKGMSILPEHALIHNKDNKKVTLTPLNAAEIFVNGRQISNEVELNQNDRILFGGNHLYVFANPAKKGVKSSQEITYDTAQKELAKNVGIAGSLAGRRSKGKCPTDAVLEEELINLLPNVYRANSMAKELKRDVAFEIVLMAPEARGLSEGLTEVCVKVHNKADDTSFVWDKNRFMNRYYGMQEMYQNYVEGDAEWNLPRERDPFYEPPDSSVVIGTATVFLQSLAYMVELDEQVPITDIHGSETGQLSVAMRPCSASGKEILGEFVENPRELVGKNLGFKVMILSALGLPRRIDQSWCKYRFFDKGEITTGKVKGNVPAYGHEEVFIYRPVTNELMNYLKEGSVTITVFGTQRSRESHGSYSEASSRISNYTNE